ncbi:MAG: VOC family protein [Caulobacterales bacterium]
MSENVNPAEVQRGLFPHLICAGAAQAIDFYKNAFGAEEMMRMPGPDGRLMHAAIMLNGHMVMLVDEMPEHGSLGPKALKGTPVVIHLNVPDVDAQIARAEKAGAKVIMPAADMFWGDRYGQVQDPFGHMWSIATPQKRLSPDELKEAAKNAMCGAGQK